MGKSDHLSSSQYTVYSVFLGLIFIISLAMQIVAMLALRRKENQTKKLTPYWKNLIICNMVVIIGSISISFASALTGDFVLNDTGCQVVGLISGLGCIAGIVNLPCCTAKIYYTVTSQKANNLVFAQASNPVSNLHMLLGVWFYSCLCISPPLLGWGEFTYESGRTSCAPNWRGNSVNGISYVMCLVVLAFVVPILVSCVFLRKIYAHFKSVNMVALDGYKKSLLLSNKKVAVIVTVMIATTVIGWCPYAMCAVISAVKGKDLHSTVIMSVIPSLFAKFTYTYNPILFMCLCTR